MSEMLVSAPTSESLVDGHLVTLGYFKEGQTLPLVVKPAAPGVDLLSWVEKNRSFVKERLYDNGGILFRGFDNCTRDTFEAFINASSSTPLQYQERSSPRTQVKGNIYTSTEHPQNQSIFLHNENSYQATWPMNLFFLCDIEPTDRGETPIADCRKIFKLINPDLRKRFEEKGFQIVRNYDQGMGLPWTTVFETSDKAEVDSYCASKGIQTEWKPYDGLRTITRRPQASMQHPKTGVMTWFNHGTFFHVSTLEPEIREVLLSCMDEEDLPTNTYYGDGSKISDEDLDHLRDCYHKETIKFAWRKGDILIIDNMLTAHGRSPFTGNRKILVGMSEPMDREKALAEAAALPA